MLEFLSRVLGKITVETPKYAVLATAKEYQIRKYPTAVIAEVTYDPAKMNNDKDGGFQILADYIGAFGKAYNKRPETIAMTAPVITKAAENSEPIAMTAPVFTKAAENSEPIAMTAPVFTKAAESSEAIAMTAPVVTKSGGQLITMTFILPSKYAKAEDAPVPVDDRIVIRDEEGKKYAVATFSGLTRDGPVAERVQRLKACLERDGIKITGDYVLARYNPPFTPPPLRTNEIMIPVE